VPAPYPADLYSAVHHGTPGDTEFYRRACEGSRSVLELGCGWGRVLYQLSAEYRVGIELHAGLLAMAREHPQAPSVTLIEADMVDMPSPGRFDRIIIPYSGVYCVLELERLRRLFENVRRHLSPGGELLFDAYSADEFHQEADPDDLSGSEFVSVATVECRGTRFEVLESSEWDHDAQRIDLQYLHIPEGRDEGILADLSHHYLLTEDIEAELRRAGFEDLCIAGDFEGSPHEPESELVVVRARASDLR
jgi:SAM-dependent methyltransferase